MPLVSFDKCRLSGICVSDKYNIIKKSRSVFVQKHHIIAIAVNGSRSHGHRVCDIEVKVYGPPSRQKEVHHVLDGAKLKDLKFNC